MDQQPRCIEFFPPEDRVVLPIQEDEQSLSNEGSSPDHCAASIDVEGPRVQQGLRSSEGVLQAFLDEFHLNAGLGRLATLHLTLLKDFLVLLPDRVACQGCQRSRHRPFLTAEQSFYLVMIMKLGASTWVA